jgi:hypothetical protein
LLKDAVLSKWFYGKYLAVSFGIALSTSRLGSVAAGFLLPAIAGSPE